MTHKTTAAVSAALTAVYLKLGFPIFPAVFWKTVSNRPDTIEGQVNIVPQFQSVSTNYCYVQWENILT